MPTDSPTASSNDRVLRQVMVGGVFLLIVFIGYGMLQYPRIVSDGGVLSVVVPVVLLLLYAGAALWGTHWSSHAHRVVVWDGTVFGLLISGLFVVMISLENFIVMSSQYSTIATLSLMLLIFLLFASAGWRGAINSGQVRLGILASMWSAMVSVLIALLYGFAINFLFTHRLEQNLQASAEYVRSGIPDLTTFTFYNTLDSATSHLLEAPIIAAVFGALGSLLGSGLTWLRAKIIHRKSEQAQRR